MNDDFDRIWISEDMRAQLRRLAQQRALSVSDIVQDALGEYLVTREAGVNLYNIIHSIEQSLCGAQQFTTCADLSDLVLFIKSPLRRVYRPELKYEVRIARGDQASVGRLNVLLRSHDMETLRGFAAFVGRWMELERNYLARSQNRQVIYWTDADYFGRQIYCSVKEGSEQLIGEAISNYIHVFDELLKHHFSNWNDGQTLEPLYLARLKSGKLTI